MSPSRTPGFTLVEMAVTILVLGLLFAFSVPAFQSVSASYQLKGATENVAAQLRMSREKAMATGMDQPMHWAPGFMSSDYHIHYPSGFIPTTAKWKLPRGITLYGWTNHPNMLRDGRIQWPGMVILRDVRGNRDTVSFLSSGLILTK
jgi:prepilin-type N-terminal cleavage/methylation domain-containing protein